MVVKDQEKDGLIFTRKPPPHWIILLLHKTLGFCWTDIVLCRLAMLVVWSYLAADARFQLQRGPFFFFATESAHSNKVNFFVILTPGMP